MTSSHAYRPERSSAERCWFLAVMMSGDPLPRQQPHRG
jgi:hypothetical protein